MNSVAHAEMDWSSDEEGFTLYQAHLEVIPLMQAAYPEFEFHTEGVGDEPPEGSPYDRYIVRAQEVYMVDERHKGFRPLWPVLSPSDAVRWVKRTVTSPHRSPAQAILKVLAPERYAEIVEEYERQMEERHHGNG